jgi:hypothetical protein
MVMASPRLDVGLWRMCKYEVLFRDIFVMYSPIFFESFHKPGCIQIPDDIFLTKLRFRRFAVQGTSNLCYLTSVTLKSRSNQKPRYYGM